MVLGVDDFDSCTAGPSNQHVSAVDKIHNGEDCETTSWQTRGRLE